MKELILSPKCVISNMYIDFHLEVNEALSRSHRLRVVAAETTSTTIDLKVWRSRSILTKGTNLKALKSSTLDELRITTFSFKEDTMGIEEEDEHFKIK